MTHQQLSDHHHRQEEGETKGLVGDLHAVPESFDPRSIKNAEDEDESVKIIVHVPARELAVFRDVADVVSVIVLEHLHADHGEGEEGDEQEESPVPQPPQ